MRLLFRFAVMLAFCFAIGDVAHADPLTNPDTPQSLAALWPMLAVGIANLAGLMIPRLSAEFTFFHSTAGKATLTAAGAFISAVPSAIQAHGLCWAMLAWAALGCVGALTSATNTTAKSTAAALLPLLLLPMLVSSGCAGFKAPAYSTLTTMAAATGAAAVQLPPICESEENAAVDSSTSKDDATAKAGAIHARCQTTLAILKGTGDGLTSARDAIHDAPTGADLTAVMPWLRLAIKQYCDIAPLLSSFPALKAKLPTIPGVC